MGPFRLVLGRLADWDEWMNTLPSRKPEHHATSCRYGPRKEVEQVWVREQWRRTTRTEAGFAGRWAESVRVNEGVRAAALPSADWAVPSASRALHLAPPRSPGVTLELAAALVPHHTLELGHLSPLFHITFHCAHVSLLFSINSESRDFVWYVPAGSPTQRTQVQRVACGGSISLTQ